MPNSSARLFRKFPKGTEGKGEMTANVLSRIFTIEIGDTPMLTFEAQNQREAQELVPQAMVEGRPGRGQVPWCPVVGWEGQAAGTDRAARRLVGALASLSDQSGSSAKRTTT